MSEFHVRNFWDDFQRIMSNPDAVTLFEWLKFRAEREGGTESVQTGRGYQRLKLERGQLIGGERYLAQKLGWTRHRVRQALNHLSDHLTTQNINHQITIISFLNYDRYNGPLEKLDHQTA